MTAADDRAVLVLDFDGTVCVGDAPVWAYADAALAAAAASSSTRAAVRAGLGAYLAGTPEAPVYADGYAAVAALMASRLAPEELAAAFRMSRRALAEGEVPVRTPDGLPDFLAVIGPRVRRVLVTNAPDEGVRETLERLGVLPHLDDIVTEAAKPEGWARLLPAILAGAPASRLISVGDIWRNDLAAPYAAGCGVALIDRFGQQDRDPAHLVARTFEQLYDDLAEWARDPEGFLAAHPASAPSASAPMTSTPTAALPSHRTGTP
jgi:FMN phosphatase YigB (HAD superfamily)